MTASIHDQHLAAVAAEHRRRLFVPLALYEACRVPGCGYAWSPRYFGRGKTAHKMHDHEPAGRGVNGRVL